MSAYKIVNADELKKMQDCLILDVRTHDEHEAAHLRRKHHHVPLDRLDAREFMTEEGLGHGDSVYILCKSGMRARAAAEKFCAAGYENVHVIEGGIIACEKCGEDVNG